MRTPMANAPPYLNKGMKPTSILILK